MGISGGRLLVWVAAAVMPISVSFLCSSTADGASAHPGPVLATGTARTSPNWTKQTGAAVGAPTPRQEVAMAYDPGAGYVLLFGGMTTTHVYGDTWSYAGGRWEHLTPTPHPSARYGSTLVWDAADGYMLLFGGVSRAGNALNDTWAFRNGTWTRIHSTVSPPPRGNFAMAYDPADQEVVLFGGAIPATTTYYGDTWAFHQGEWLELSADPSPGPRAGSAMAYDGADGYLILFGGTEDYQCATCDLEDTWKFSAGEWTILVPFAPLGPRYGDGLTYDSALGAVLLFGGWNQDGDCPVVSGDTWEFSGGQWTRLITSSAPSARAGEGLADDPNLSGALLFGGSSGTCGEPSTFDRDTWALA